MDQPKGLLLIGWIRLPGGRGRVTRLVEGSDVVLAVLTGFPGRLGGRPGLRIRLGAANNLDLPRPLVQDKEIVNRNSQNSSPLPSPDRPEQKPAKEPSGLPRERDRQPGHRGHHRVLVDDVDEVIVYKPASCAGCGALLLGEDPAPYRHQVTELPIVKPKVIEYQVHRLSVHVVAKAIGVNYPLRLLQVGLGQM